MQRPQSCWENCCGPSLFFLPTNMQWVAICNSHGAIFLKVRECAESRFPEFFVYHPESCDEKCSDPNFSEIPSCFISWKRETTKLAGNSSLQLPGQIYKRHSRELFVKARSLLFLLRRRDFKHLTWVFGSSCHRLKRWGSMSYYKGRPDINETIKEQSLLVDQERNQACTLLSANYWAFWWVVGVARQPLPPFHASLPFLPLSLWQKAHWGGQRTARKDVGALHKQKNKVHVL